MGIKNPKNLDAEGFAAAQYSDHSQLGAYGQTAAQGQQQARDALISSWPEGGRFDPKRLKRADPISVFLMHLIESV